MQVQVKSDDQVEGDATLTARVADLVETGLGRFAARVSRVEVHLSDENKARSGQDDKRCLLEARVEGRDPVAVTHRAATVDHAVSGAVKKMFSSLDTSFGRSDELKRRGASRD